MSAPRQTRLPAPRRRALIEDAAAKLFSEQGYGPTTMDDIAAAAGVTKPILYRHFDSKKALHLALLERARDELAAAPLDEYLHGEGSPAERVPAMLEAWFAHVEEHPYTWRLLFRDTTGDPEVQALHRELQRRQRAADVALMREIVPGLPEEELEPLGEVIRSSFYALALWWLEHPDVPRAVLVSAMSRVTRGITLGASG